MIRRNKGKRRNSFVLKILIDPEHLRLCVTQGRCWKRKRVLPYKLFPSVLTGFEVGEGMEL